MSSELSEGTQHLRTYTVLYACGSPMFPHREIITLDNSSPDHVPQQLLAEKRQMLCPGCLLDKKYQEAQQASADLGLKPLIGPPGHVEMAEIVRSEVVFLCLPFFREAYKQFLTTLNRPANRLALLWVNYRNARWDEQCLEELIQALQDNSAS